MTPKNIFLWVLWKYSKLCKVVAVICLTQALSKCMLQISMVVKIFLICLQSTFYLNVSWILNLYLTWGLYYKNTAL
jgi:hypothetical protein